MVLFSIQKGRLERKAQNFAISSSMTDVKLNALGVIVLSEATDEFSVDTAPDPTSVRGVNALPTLKGTQLEIVYEDPWEIECEDENGKEVF